MADRDPITCHILNTFNGTPAPGLACTLTLHSILLPAGAPQPANLPATLHAVTDVDGRIKHWHPPPHPPSSATTTTAATTTTSPAATGTGTGTGTTSSAAADTTATPAPGPSIRSLLASIHEQRGGQQRSIWTLRIRNVGEWYAEQGVESFWREIEVQFLVKGSERWDGWRHYHVPVLLGPWNYTTYRGS
ncbi:transthyretin domain-containing protein [Histoplasma capsulatum var. duboisii H88]|uniref:Transthyretin domain-containing protein n=1 Tax=Ajellomyces capsulatus (strain H88) TaxID=544711 RepID=F0U8B1_AJEC8|nr:transthyretin domain-containing protein [Histoplasma capsulatum var. duboisii H88]QSS52691.1 transthyretin domain-containing protein [Histoplasma capsulatum var. duboisii H88]